jgi:hypothetical protein
MNDNLLTHEQFQQRYVRFCPTCDTDTMPSDFGHCFFCGSLIVKASRTHFGCGHPRKKNVYFNEEGKTECFAVSGSGVRMPL